MTLHVPRYRISTNPDGHRQALCAVCGETSKPSSHRPLVDQWQRTHTAEATRVQRRSK